MCAGFAAAATLTACGPGPCAKYDAYYREHQGGGTIDEQLEGNRLLAECQESGGSPLTGEDR